MHIDKGNARLTAALAVLLLHGLAIAALLSASRYIFIMPEKAQPRMTWLSLPYISEPPPAAKERPPVAAPSVPIVAPPANEVLVPSAPNNAITLPPSLLNSHVLGVLGQVLSCDQKRDKLSEEEKARCGQALGQTAIEPSPLNAPSILDPGAAQQFAHALGEKQAPFLLPCLTANGLADIVPLLGCLAKTASDGYSADNNPGGRYSDAGKAETYFPQDRDSIHWQSPNTPLGR